MTAKNYEEFRFFWYYYENELKDPSNISLYETFKICAKLVLIECLPGSRDEINSLNTFDEIGASMFRLSAMAQEMDSLRAELQEKNQEPARLKTELQKINRECAELKAESQKINRECARLKAEIRKIDQKMDALRSLMQNFGDFLNSTDSEKKIDDNLRAKFQSIMEVLQS